MKIIQTQREKIKSNLRLGWRQLDGVERQLDDLVPLSRKRVDDAVDARIVRFRKVRTAELSVRLSVRVGVDHTLATCTSPTFNCLIPCNSQVSHGQTDRQTHTRARLIGLINFNNCLTDSLDGASDSPAARVATRMFPADEANPPEAQLIAA